MRLGQLARKLSLKPAEIVEFLASQNIQIGEGSNTRIEDEHALIVIRHYAPGLENLLKEQEVEQIKTTETQVEVMPEVNAEVPEVKTEVINEKIESQQDVSLEVGEQISESVDTTAAETYVTNDDVIKAPKVELPGLKVIGKIDLPEPKKKEPELKPEQSEEVSQVEEHSKKIQQDDRKPSHQRRDRNDVRPRKNPIALQREREALEAEKKRRAELEREKEKRTRNYLKKVKPNQPTKAARLVSEPVVQMSNVEEDEKPKTWLGKFIRWLTKAE
jgi:hypothetical protein